MNLKLQVLLGPVVVFVMFAGVVTMASVLASRNPQPPSPTRSAVVAFSQEAAPVGAPPAQTGAW